VQNTLKKKENTITASHYNHSCRAG